MIHLRSGWGKLRKKRKSLRASSMASGSSQEVNVTLSQPSTRKNEPQDFVPTVELHHDQHTSPNTDDQEESSQQHGLDLPLAAVLRPEIAKAPVTPPESIWNEAYGELAVKEVKLVRNYEKIVAFKLGRESADSWDLTTEENTIERDNVLLRRAQMHQLIQDGLEKITRETKVKQNMSTASQVVNATKRLVADAVRDIPQAALPWAIVSVSLEMLMNPISEAKSNQEGVEYIGATIQWYWEQAAHIFDSQERAAMTGVQRSLYSAFVDFYRSLLQFQMSSICSYYRNRGFAFLKDIVKLDDWEGKLNAIRKEDQALRDKITTSLRLESESHLKGLVNHTKRQEDYQQTKEDRQCLTDLRITDPSADRDRIENTKGGLLQDSYLWILENEQFKAWRDSDGNRLLWLRGDPGKGKTMLLCGLIQELRQKSAPSLVTFFFCQATDPKNNNSTAVLRGLMWLLANKQPSLISYIRRVYDPAGKTVFDEGNAWYTLSEVFKNMLGHEGLPPVSIVIDALDECTEGRLKLLDLIQQTSALSNVKWIVSSRNWNEIEDKLSEGTQLSLEVNAELVRTAVYAYISEKAAQISLLKQDDKLRKEVCRRMQEKADGTFLWVAIVFQRLSSESYAHYDRISDILDLLDEMPADLYELYGAMLKRISELGGRGPELCRTILATVTVAYRPLHLNELSTLVGFKDNLKKLPRLKEVINDCGSFLTVRENVLYFIHQSAKEYLALPQSVIFPHGPERSHYDVVLNSLDVMAHTLKQNIYGLEHLGLLIDDINPPDPNPLHEVLYSCINWIAHFCEVASRKDESHLFNGLIDNEMILGFFKRHFLHWLEALSLTRTLPHNISNIKRLNGLLKASANDELQRFVYDASRFMRYHAQIMESAPMQIYVSALLFSPSESLVRTQFGGDLSSWIDLNPTASGKWSPCLQIIETNGRIKRVDSSGINLLTLYFDSQNVDIWDIASGRRIQTLKHTETVKHAMVLIDSGHIVTFTGGLVCFWDASSGAIISERSIHGLNIDWDLAPVSSEGRLIAFHTEDAIQIFDVVEGTKLQIPPFAAITGRWRAQLRLSKDSKFLACDGRIKLISADVTGSMKQLETDNFPTYTHSLSFSNDSKLIAIGEKSTIAIWDSDSKVKLMTLVASDEAEFSDTEFSKDGRLIAATGRFPPEMGSRLVIVWDTTTGKVQHRLSWNGFRLIRRLVWLDDARALAVVLSNTVEIFDVSERTFWNSGGGKEEGYVDNMCLQLSFSTDLQLAATVYGHDIRIWATTTGSEIRTLKFASRNRLERTLDNDWKSPCAFSPDFKSFLTYSPHRGFFAFDIASGRQMETFPLTVLGRGQHAVSSFSLDGNYMAEAPYVEERDPDWNSLRKGAVRIWNLPRKEAVQQLITHIKVEFISLLAFSNNSKHLVLLSEHTELEVWSVATGKKVWATADYDRPKQDKEPICETCHSPRSRNASIAVSDDGKIVLFAEAGRHRMWILTHGSDNKDNMKVRWQSCCGDFEPSFDTESPYILTRLGRIHLDTLLAHKDHLRMSHGYQYMTQGYGLNHDSSWVTWNGRNIIWLPQNYRRGRRRAIFRNWIIMATDLTGLLSIRFSGPPPSWSIYC